MANIQECVCCMYLMYRVYVIDDCRNLAVRWFLLVCGAVNGNERVVDVKNKPSEEIWTQVMRLRNSTGRKVVKLKTRHVTHSPSVQGTWTPQTEF